MRYLIILTFLVLKMSLLANTDTQLNGKQLFKNNCKACHNIDKKLVGPALKNLSERRDSTWIYDFIKSPKKMMDNGDEVAIALFKEFNEVLMPNQYLKDNEIASILEYIELESKAEKNVDDFPQRNFGTYSFPFKFSNFLFWIPYTLVVILLIVVLYHMTIYTDLQKQKIADKNNI